MKEDGEAVLKQDLEKKLEESPITSEKIAETVEKLEKKRKGSKEQNFKQSKTSARKGSSASKRKVRGPKSYIWRS